VLAVVPRQLSQEILPKVVHRRCGVNGDGPSCVDKNNYHTRCKCYKMKLACTKTCKCKDCSNSFGKRTIQGKCTRENHSHQISLPNSKRFAEDRSEKLKQGPWTSLENSIFLFIIEKFQMHSKEISVENMLKAFNEIASLSDSMYSCMDIPDYIIKPSTKSFSQMSRKLKHYFDEMAFMPSKVSINHLN